MKNFIYIVIALVLTSCLKEDQLNLPYNSIQPKYINDGHQISSLSDENLDSLLLTTIFKETYTSENLWPIRSLLVFRNNKLVAETYHKNENDITNRQMIWSCTKQVMGVLTGIALDKGVINSIADPISKYLKDDLIDYPEKSDITIEQLIIMKSGIDYNNDGVAGETDKILRQIPENITSYILSLPMKTKAGSEFFYKDGDPQLMSAIIHKASEQTTDEWADQVLFSKIGVKNYNWVRYKDGTTLGGFGIETTPREMAKIALCVADSGRYNNEQIVSKSWITEMTKTQVEVSTDYSFGYYWWIDVKRNIHFMWGHGGQFAFIVPDQNLIVVMTSIPNTQGKYQIQADEALVVVDQIIEACY